MTELLKIQGGMLPAVTAVTIVLATSFPDFFNSLAPSAETISLVLMQVFFTILGATGSVWNVINTAPSIFLFAVIQVMVHLAMTLLLGKLFCIDMKLLLLASNANIGGPTTACAMATAKGANQSVYAPEPFDVGRILQADILSNGQKVTLTTDGPIDSDSCLQSRVESLMRKSNSEFNVVISQMNGQDYASRTHVFTVGKTRIKLSRGWITKAREIYSTSMQLCGVRGNIKVPAKALFWQPRKSLTFIVTFESEQERNTAITLARKYAFDCNVTLLGPDD